jgi:hypothetical protein
MSSLNSIQFREMMIRMDRLGVLPSQRSAIRDWLTESRAAAEIKSGGRGGRGAGGVGRELDLCFNFKRTADVDMC